MCSKKRSVFFLVVAWLKAFQSFSFCVAHYLVVICTVHFFVYSIDLSYLLRKKYKKLFLIIINVQKAIPIQWNFRCWCSFLSYLPSSCLVCTCPIRNLFSVSTVTGLVHMSTPRSLYVSQILILCLTGNKDVYFFPAYALFSLLRISQS